MIESKLRPAITLTEAMALRDIIRKVVVRNVMSEEPFLTTSEVTSLKFHELKLSELIIRAETRKAIQELN